MCLCVCVCAQVCRARPEPRGLTRIDTHSRTLTYFKIVIGTIQTHALQLHTLRMQTLEMIKKLKHLIRRDQGFVE